MRKSRTRRAAIAALAALALVSSGTFVGLGLSAQSHAIAAQPRQDTSHVTVTDLIPAAQQRADEKIVARFAAAHPQPSVWTVTDGHESARTSYAWMKSVPWDAVYGQWGCTADVSISMQRNALQPYRQPAFSAVVDCGPSEYASSLAGEVEAKYDTVAAPSSASVLPAVLRHRYLAAHRAPVVASGVALGPATDAGDAAVLTGILHVRRGCVYITPTGASGHGPDILPVFPRGSAIWDGTTLIAQNQHPQRGDAVHLGGGYVESSERSPDTAVPTHCSARMLFYASPRA